MPEAIGIGTGWPQLRADRLGSGNGRGYSLLRRGRDRLRAARPSEDMRG